MFINTHFADRWWWVFLLLFFGVGPVSAETLISLRDGHTARREDLLKAGKILVYIEKDCGACHSYLKQWTSCSEALKSRLILVSVSSVVQTKEMTRWLPPGIPLLVAKGFSQKRTIFATPTTQVGAMQKVGTLTCSELRQLSVTTDSRKQI